MKNSFDGLSPGLTLRGKPLLLKIMSPYHGGRTGAGFIVMVVRGAGVCLRQHRAVGMGRDRAAAVQIAAIMRNFGQYCASVFFNGLYLADDRAGV